MNQSRPGGGDACPRSRKTLRTGRVPRIMKILLINKFLFPKGGDAISVLNTGKVLADRGHEVHYWGMAHPDNPRYPYEDYFVSRVDYEQPGGLARKLDASLKILYSFEARRKLEKLLAVLRPDLVHVHNFAHQISPSILPACARRGLPVVMTMHDYKLVCPTYSLLLNGRPCERCGHGKYWWCFLKKCAKGSYAKSLVNTAEMFLHHKILNLYRLIERFVAPSEFMLRKVREMGFPGQIRHVANFIQPEDYQPRYGAPGGDLVYFGRLSAEKGLPTLLQAMAGLDVRLKIIGEGPLRAEMERSLAERRQENVRFLGYLRGQELRAEIQSSQAAILPSECYENNPLSVLEAFALGKPVVGARIGGIPELVQDGFTGLTFSPGDAGDLRRQILRLRDQPGEAERWGRNAREWVEKNGGPELHYERLLQVYHEALESRPAAGRRA